MSMKQELINALMAYMKAKGWAITQEAGCYNIIYLEGATPALEPNDDAPDGWNDRRLLIDYTDGRWRCSLNAAASTEPGRSATDSPSAAKRGGVFRIKIGQQCKGWVMGFHKRRSTHPALVHNLTNDVWGHRDRNRDGLRTNEPLVRGVGINQHGTASGIAPGLVGKWSEGCLVGRDWKEHMHFMELLQHDARYLHNRWFAFDTTVIDTTDFARWRKTQSPIT